mgnify:CR=1 FL=1
MTNISGLIPGMRYGEGDGGGEGAGGDDKNAVNPDDPVVKALVDKAVQEATAGLRKNKDEILAEKKKLDDQLQTLLSALGGEEGVKQAQEMRERLAKDETNKLLAEGNYEGWFEQRTVAMKTAHGKEVEAKEKVISDLTAERDEAVRRLNDYQINAAIAAGCQEVAVKGAYHKAVAALVRDTIKLDENGEVIVFEDDGKTQRYGKQGKPMSVAEAIDSLREKMPDMFEPSSGGGASGGGRAGHSGPNPWRAGTAEWNITEQGRITRSNPELAKRLMAEANSAAAGGGKK